MLYKNLTIKELDEKKPCEATLRPESYFNVGDEVVCFISEHIASRSSLKAGTFATGKVIWLETRLGKYISVDIGYNPEHRFNFKINSPEVMHKEDYEYLKTKSPHQVVRGIFSFKTAKNYNCTVLSVCPL